MHLNSLKNCTQEKVIEYVKKCKLPCILIFWQDNEDVHFEPCAEGRFLNEIQPEIQNMLMRKCYIREFRLCHYERKIQISLV